MTAYPTKDEYKGALARLYHRFSEQQQRMLDAHINAPDFRMTSTQLAEAAGYPAWQTANSQYGRIGTLLREELNFDGEGQQSAVFASFSKPDSDDSEWIWELRPDFAAAIREHADVS